MAAHHNTGYDYLPGLSTAGIIYNGGDGIPRFTSRLGQTSFPHLPQVGNHQINICSSSDGLMACHDPLSNIYYIGNPDIPNSYTALPQTPRQHNRFNSSAVLATDYTVQCVHLLICAVNDGMTTTYNFDAYCSSQGRWLSHEGIDVGCYIIPHTGVSCGTLAYWLTEVPRSVIRFDLNCPENMLSTIPLDRRSFGSLGSMLQLGRVGNNLGLVTLDSSLNPMVVLYFLEQGNIWQLQPHVSFNLPISYLSTTRLIRFQSFKVELFFLVDGQLFMWEKSTVDHGSFLWTLNRGELQLGSGLPHVTTPLLPGNFPMTIQNIDRDDDDDDDDDDGDGGGGGGGGGDGGGGDDDEEVTSKVP